MFEDKSISHHASPGASEAAPKHGHLPAQGENGFVGLGHMGNAARVAASRRHGHAGRAI